MTALTPSRTSTRTPRNHARRVEDLQELHRQGLIRFVQSSKDRTTRVWTYTVEAAGQRMDLPTRLVDTWIVGFRQGAAVAATLGRMNGTRRNGHHETDIRGML